MPEENDKYENKIKELEQQLSEIKLQLEETKALLQKEQEQHKFYQRVADFTFGWELWFDPGRNIKYCSPSCKDITGYTANQIVASDGISELLVYSTDKERFDRFLSQALDQDIINQSLEFRIITRTKQLRWCVINIRGVYNPEGRYLGIRATIKDITHLKQAMGHIQQLSEKKEIESRNHQRLTTELEMKERELVAFLLQLSKKNELIAMINKKLRTISKESSRQKQQKILKLIEVLDNTAVTPVDWEMLNIQLEKLYPGFMNRLMVKHPRLTVKEKKLCASLRLGLSSKEIAGLNNITPQSVEVARVRLRKKLKLPHKIRLAQYLEHI